MPGVGGISLTWLAGQLGLPKSTASVLVKDLARRGFVRRARDQSDERRLAIVLTPEGVRRVQADTVLEPARLGAALGGLPEARRSSLVVELERLADAAEEPRHG